jgi:hypothetical protein
LLESSVIRPYEGISSDILLGKWKIQEKMFPKGGEYRKNEWGEGRGVAHKDESPDFFTWGLFDPKYRPHVI